jgi:hypothetical protein
MLIQANVSDPDAIVAALQGMAKEAAMMPKSFEKHGVAYDSGDTDGASIGKVLPGRGFMSRIPLKQLGITKQPPGIYDPDRYRRIEDEVRKAQAKIGQDRFGQDIYSVQGAAISSYDAIIAGRGNGKAEDITIVKSSQTTAANIWSSTLYTAGGNPPAGTWLATTAPTDRVATRATTGAMSAYLSNPTSPDKKYLLTFGFAAGQQINMMVLVDIVNDSGIYRLSVNTEEIVASPTNATRQYGSGTGIGNLLTFVAQAAATPGAASTFTYKYIDQGGASTTAPTVSCTNTACAINNVFLNSAAVTGGAGTLGLFAPIDSADTGVQAIKSAQISVAGSGALAGVVCFPLLFVPGIAANAYIERDSTAQIDGVVELVQASSVLGFLSAFVLPNTTSTGVVTAHMKTVAG